jgi:type 1 glutamine amidotransferase
MKILFAIILLLFPLQLIAQKEVLVYTHNGKGYVHDNIPASTTMLQRICKEEKWNILVTDNPEIFEKDLSRFNCIIFSNSNNEAFYSQNQRQAFQDYIRNGGGFVGIHSASGSERQWPWFWAMLGGKFVRHPELQPFEIKVLDKKHPATKHLGNNWQWEDEFYYLNQLNPDIHILLAGNLSDIKDEKKTEYPGEVFGQWFPLSWSHEFDGGKQFYTALGHKPEHYTDPDFIKHITGGIKWVMQLSD